MSNTSRRNDDVKVVSPGHKGPGAKVISKDSKDTGKKTEVSYGSGDKE